MARVRVYDMWAQLRKGIKSVNVQEVVKLRRKAKDEHESQPRSPVERGIFPLSHTRTSVDNMSDYLFAVRQLQPHYFSSFCYPCLTLLWFSQNVSCIKAVKVKKVHSKC